MKREARNRLTLLRSLLELSAPLGELADEVSKLDFDYDGVGIELTSAHLRQVLLRYIQGELPQADIEAWANMIEGRDDVRIPDRSRDEVESVLHELANPYLTHRLDAERAGHLLDLLTPETPLG